MIEAYPLCWPVGWPRTADLYRERPRFQVSLARARDDLLGELGLMGATGVVVSSNAVLRRDGLPVAKQPRVVDPGVAVYFGLDGEQRCVPCDRWGTIEGNVRAIGLTVAALRGLDRWGTGGIVAAAFRGFAALPAEAGGTAWWDVLDVDPHWPAHEIEAAYRRLALVHHPDRGGDPARFRWLTEAYEQAKEARRRADRTTGCPGGGRP